MKQTSITFMMFTALALVAVGQVPEAKAGDKEMFGTVVGAGLGGLLGNQFGRGEGQAAATGAGVLLGGLLGNSIGSSMEMPRSDPGGSPFASNPAEPLYYAGGYGYSPNYVAPPAPPPPPPMTYIDDNSGSFCREYSQQVRIAGQLHESYGTACLQPDGSWRIVQ